MTPVRAIGSPGEVVDGVPEVLACGGFHRKSDVSFFFKSMSDVTVAKFMHMYM
jgi:hypothetical protein